MISKKANYFPNGNREMVLEMTQVLQWLLKTRVLKTKSGNERKRRFKDEKV